MSAYRSSLFRSLKKEVSEKLPQGKLGCCSQASALQPVIGELPFRVRTGHTGKSVGPGDSKWL